MIRILKTGKIWGSKFIDIPLKHCGVESTLETENGI